MRVAWVYDAQAHSDANAAGRNYWPVYTEEILRRLGITPERLAPADARDLIRLAGYAVVVAGSHPGVSPTVPSAAEAWVRAGGILIGFATVGLEELFGIRVEGCLKQPEGDFGIAAYLRLADCNLASDVHPAGFEDQPLLVVSPVRLVVADDEGVETLATVMEPSPDAPTCGRRAVETPYAGVTLRRVGAGYACYFAFDVAQTMWAIHQGRPIDRDYDGDGYLRAMDARIVGDNDVAVPYTDVLQSLLRVILGLRPIPMVDALPPAGGRVADAVFYFGGDDEGEAGNQVPASDFMRSRGLPYHINLMPVGEGFAVSAQEAAHIEANGHELALHYNFVDGFSHPCGFAEHDVRAQADQFMRAFGRSSRCSVNHWCRWCGWADPARWIAATGGTGDNSWFGPEPVGMNPTNVTGFSFGTAFPRHVWDDWRHGNRRLPFVQEAITGYEVGYQDEQCDPAAVRRAVDLALAGRLTMCLFYHPVYIAGSPGCREAIDELLRYVDELGATVAYMGSDRLNEWWMNRDATTVEDALFDGNLLEFVVDCPDPSGCVIRVCLGQSVGARCFVESADVIPKRVTECASNWAYFPVPIGRHRVAVQFLTA